MKVEKLYYSIGEVCGILDLEAHVLRFWEEEFSELKPEKSDGGTRRYRKKDIELLKRINHLLNVECYTHAGVRRQLKSRRMDKTKMIRRELEDILKLLR